MTTKKPASTRAEALRRLTQPTSIVGLAAAAAAIFNWKAGAGISLDTVMTLITSAALLVVDEQPK